MIKILKDSQGLQIVKSFFTGFLFPLSLEVGLSPGEENGRRRKIISYRRDFKDYQRPNHLLTCRQTDTCVVKAGIWKYFKGLENTLTVLALASTRTVSI